MRVFITGGTGFIGSSIARAWAEQKDTDIAILKRSDSSLHNLEAIQHNLRLYDYSGDYASVSEAMEDFKPEVVIHLAAYYVNSHSHSDVDLLIDSNIRLGLHLAEAMIEHQVSRLVNTGTSFEHFRNKKYNPVNLYAATKHAFEDILHFYTGTKQLSVITLKLFDTYGEGDNRGKLLQYLRQIAGTDQVLKLSGGEQLLDFVHIEDVIGAYKQSVNLLMDHPLGYNAIFGVGSEKRLSLKELVGLIEKVSGKQIPVEFGARPYRDREVMKPWTDFKTLPGWEPRLSLEKGLKRYFSSGL